MGSAWGSQHGNGGVLQESLCWASAMDQEGCSAPRPITAKAREGHICSDIPVLVASGCWLVTPQPHSTGCPSWSLAPEDGAGIPRCSITFLYRKSGPAIGHYPNLFLRFPASL